MAKQDTLLAAGVGTLAFGNSKYAMLNRQRRAPSLCFTLSLGAAK
jgi:hypothetical protein